MNIYSIRFEYFLELPGIQGSESQTILDEGKLEIGANSVTQALLEADEFIAENVTVEFEIKSIKLLEKINIVNWPGDGDDCQCARCRTERAAPEDCITFQCTCGEIYTLIDDFGGIQCKECHKIIRREDLIGNNGNYTLIDI